MALELEMLDVMGDLYALFPLPFTHEGNPYVYPGTPPPLMKYQAELVSRNAREIIQVNEILDMDNVILQVVDPETKKETYHIFRKAGKSAGSYDWQQGNMVSRSKRLTVTEKVKMEDCTSQITRYRRILSVLD